MKVFIFIFHFFDSFYFHKSEKVWNVLLNKKRNEKDERHTTKPLAGIFLPVNHPNRIFCCSNDIINPSHNLCKMWFAIISHYTREPKHTKKCSVCSCEVSFAQFPLKKTNENKIKEKRKSSINYPFHSKLFFYYLI